jgi:hypothetical protein
MILKYFGNDNIYLFMEKNLPSENECSYSFNGTITSYFLRKGKAKL